MKKKHYKQGEGQKISFRSNLFVCVLACHKVKRIYDSKAYKCSYPS